MVCGILPGPEFLENSLNSWLDSSYVYAMHCWGGAPQDASLEDRLPAFCQAARAVAMRRQSQITTARA